MRGKRQGQRRRSFNADRGPTEAGARPHPPAGTFIPAGRDKEDISHAGRQADEDLADEGAFDDE
ncbi:MAG: hypothetical protein K5863_21715, partial [Nitratireductor sp.]|uniref:hypothetical protein n=1 Tax=Nitratireductor sp. TaxID=1872084 RepID=UPI0026069737